MQEIENKITNSQLEIFDLEDYYPTQNKLQIDISQWLIEGFLLKEKEFRNSLKNHDWSQYQDKLVAIYCATDAILPAWATILATTHVTSIAKFVTNGKINQIDDYYYQQLLPTLDYSKYQNKAVILKGCSKKPVPQIAYSIAVQELQKVAKSIMYGEACSAVPLFKNKK